MSLLDWIVLLPLLLQCASRDRTTLDSVADCRLSPVVVLMVLDHAADEEFSRPRPGLR